MSVLGQANLLKGPKMALGEVKSYVRFGSKADIAAPPTNVRFTPKSGHWLSTLERPLCAKSGRLDDRPNLEVIPSLKGRFRTDGTTNFLVQYDGCTNIGSTSMTPRIG
jgi:hypothetical protein